MPVKYLHKDGILQGNPPQHDLLTSEFLKSIDEDYIQQRVNTLTRNTLLITTSPPHLDSWLTLLGSYLEELQNGLANLSAEDAFEIAKKNESTSNKNSLGCPTMKLVVHKGFCTKQMEPNKLYFQAK